MADTETTDINKKVEDELTVGRFAGQQARTMGLIIGGTLAGYLLGKQLIKTSLPNKVMDLIQKHWFKEATTAEKEAIGKNVVEYGTMAVGYAAGQVGSLYEHWSKVERERLGVDEVNKNVSAMMAKRVQFEETMDRQHEIIQKLIKERKPAEEGQYLQNVLDKKTSKGNSLEK